MERATCDYCGRDNCDGSCYKGTNKIQQTIKIQKEVEELCNELNINNKEMIKVDKLPLQKIFKEGGSMDDIKMIDDDPDWRLTPEEYQQMLNKTLKMLGIEKPQKENKKMAKENVNHPKHYNREGALEAIDEMILVFGKEAVKNFCLCNSWKYRYRAADKNGEEDLEKSDWYIRKYKELCHQPTVYPTRITKIDLDEDS